MAFKSWVFGDYSIGNFWWYTSLHSSVLGGSQLLTQFLTQFSTRFSQRKPIGTFTCENWPQAHLLSTLIGYEEGKAIVEEYDKFFFVSNAS
jgi:hypothetical protein